MPETCIQPFIANGLLSDEPALRRRLSEDGYLYFSAIADRRSLFEIRSQILDLFRKADLLDESSSAEQPIAKPGAPLYQVMHAAFGLESVHAFFHSPFMMDLAAKLIGETPLIPHPHKQVRAQPAGAAGIAPHQDFLYNQGSRLMYTCWVPLGDMPAGAGGLQVLPGSHQRFHKTTSIPDSDLTGDWVDPPYRLGDLIFFTSLTAHRGQPNNSRALRLSMDCRYQALSQPFATKWLNLLPGVEEAYPGWKSQDLKYYWKRLELKTTDEFDDSHLS